MTQSQKDFVQIPSRVITQRPGIRRVAIIGMGAVGAATAFSMLQEGHARELILIDKDVARAEGEMMDLSHCLPHGRPMRLSFGDLDEAAECDLVVVTAGAAQRPGETRIDLVKRNAEIFSSFFPRLTKANPLAVFAIITNPVDIMTRFAVNESGDATGRIFGTGTVLDTARFRTLLSQHFRIDPRNIHANVIGEHGDSEVLVWSRGRIGPYSMEEYARATGAEFNDTVRADIDRSVREAAYQIIERKGSTNFAIGVTTREIHEAMSEDQNRLMTVSRPMKKVYGLEDICMSVPCPMTRDGAGPGMELSLDSTEHEALMRSAEKLDEVWNSLG